MKGKLINSRPKSLAVNLMELWDFRALIASFVRRDIKVRYAQTSLGLLWVFIQPLAYLLSFIFIFNRVFTKSLEDIPYSLFAVTGLMVWTYFSFAVTQAGSSLIGSQEIIRKVYFPKLVIPIGKAFLGLIDLFVVLGFVACLLIYHQVTISSKMLWLPIFLLLTIAFALGLGVLISAVSIRYRDVQHLVPFLVQLGMFFSPVMYPTSFITDHLPKWLQMVYYLNPVSGLIIGVRWATLGTNIDIIGVSISVVSGSLILVGAIAYFFRVERKLADEL
jgi:lipopolysaccharide transport system permease protein